jgi:hypothetical protein
MKLVYTYQLNQLLNFNAISLAHGIDSLRSVFIYYALTLGKGDARDTISRIEENREIRSRATHISGNPGKSSPLKGPGISSLAKSSHLNAPSMTSLAKSANLNAPSVSSLVKGTHLNASNLSSRNDLSSSRYLSKSTGNMDKSTGNMDKSTGNMDKSTGNMDRPMVEIQIIEEESPQLIVNQDQMASASPLP